MCACVCVCVCTTVSKSTNTLSLVTGFLVVVNYYDGLNSAFRAGKRRQHTETEQHRKHKRKKNK